MGEVLAKNIARAARIKLNGIKWRIFSELNNLSSPKLANKQADELNINGGKHVYSLFLN